MLARVGPDHFDNTFRPVTPPSYVFLAAFLGFFHMNSSHRVQLVLLHTHGPRVLLLDAYLAGVSVSPLVKTRQTHRLFCQMIGANHAAHVSSSKHQMSYMTKAQM